jgi:hypothetical protein
MMMKDDVDDVVDSVFIERYKCYLLNCIEPYLVNAA